MKKVIFGLLMCIVMATDMPAEILADTPALASDVEKIRINRVGDLLPISENTLNYSNNSESLGSPIYRWNKLYANETEVYLSSFLGDYKEDPEDYLWVYSNVGTFTSADVQIYATTDIVISCTLVGGGNPGTKSTAHFYVDNICTGFITLLDRYWTIPYNIFVKKGKTAKIIVSTQNGGSNPAGTTLYHSIMELSL